ncbi:hypothetical protein IEQ34_021070 [Dendrobium chrysotoxum]|uniref:Uncharacterized protein n=1 Tax=Dendrobium chrysotoxum TaxID=161865 RepID=A0AAV7G4S1_DENCH|nr:hypothetical protein IEQ34_021070 [Dendrobium chrysotoxum]
MAGKKSSVSSLSNGTLTSIGGWAELWRHWSAVGQNSGVGQLLGGSSVVVEKESGGKRSLFLGSFSSLLAWFPLKRNEGSIYSYIGRTLWEAGSRPKKKRVILVITTSTEYVVSSRRFKPEIMSVHISFFGFPSDRPGRYSHRPGRSSKNRNPN